MAHSDLQSFLKYTLGQREISLVIAQNDEEMTQFRDILDNNYYKRATEVPQLVANIDQPQKIYFVISHVSKDLYDLIVQYPTGQVEIFDAKKMKSIVTSPSYNDVSIVFLVKKETLSDMQNGEFSILNKVGLTFQV